MAKDKTIIIRNFEYDPFDVAVTFNNIIKEAFGNDPFVGMKERFWLPRGPLTRINVKVGLNQEVKVVTGSMEVRGIVGKFNLEGSIVQALVDKNEIGIVEALLDNVQIRLKTASKMLRNTTVPSIEINAGEFMKSVS